MSRVLGSIRPFVASFRQTPAVGETTATVAESTPSSDPPLAAAIRAIVKGSGSAPDNQVDADVPLADLASPAEATAAPAASSFGALRTLMYNSLGSWSSKTPAEVPLPHGGSKEKPPPAVAAPAKKVVTKADRIAASIARRDAREAADKRALLIVKNLRHAESVSGRITQLQHLSKHLRENPLSKSILIPGASSTSPSTTALLLRLASMARDPEEKALCRVNLSLLGRHNPPRGRGIRVLTIDGGGTRGMMSLEILSALERQLPPGTRLHDVFDLMCGVSTGGIIASLLGGFRMPVDECSEIYRDLSSKLFTRARLTGYSGLLWSHSYYDSKFWVKMLKETVGGEDSMADLVRRFDDATKLCILSCIVNTPTLEPFCFRNYAFPSNNPRQSAYAGSTKYPLWQALQASAAAPGYFEEVQLDGLVHQDGGVLVNNPTAVALHEARAIWPHESIQCVLSIGNGRSMPHSPTVEGTRIATGDVNLLRSTSLTDKIVKIVDSATDTELVHKAMRTLMEPTQYYRLNPYMNQMFNLDEIQPENLELMRTDARTYVRRNEPKLKMIADSLMANRSLVQSSWDTADTELLRRFDYSIRA